MFPYAMLETRREFPLLASFHMHTETMSHPLASPAAFKDHHFDRNTCVVAQLISISKYFVNNNQLTCCKESTFNVVTTFNGIIGPTDAMRTFGKERGELGKAARYSSCILVLFRTSTTLLVTTIRATGKQALFALFKTSRQSYFSVSRVQKR